MSKSSTPLNETPETIKLVKALLNLPTPTESSAMKELDCWTVADYILSNYLLKSEVVKAIGEYGGNRSRNKLRAEIKKDLGLEEI